MLIFLLLLRQNAPAAQNAAVDPDWLLSSTVQSAAVLVAIVGGFLVSRLVGLSSERSALVQRRHHRDELRSIKQEEYDEVHGERLAVSTEWFAEHHKDALLEAHGDADVEALLEDFIPRGSSDREMRPVAERLVSSTKAAFAEILVKFPKTAPPLTGNELRQAGVDIPEGSEDIYVAVAAYICDHIPRPRSVGAFGFDSDFRPYTPEVPTPNIVLQRQDVKISREADLASEIRALGKEIDLLDEELSEIGKPEGIRWSIGVLVYLILAGIALPTILMALRPVPDGAFARIAVVAAFISGLVVLVIYLTFRVRSLRPPPRKVHARVKIGWHVRPIRRRQRD